METIRQSVVNLVSYLNISKSSRLSPAAAGEPMRAGELPLRKPPKKSRPASSRRSGPKERTSQPVQAGELPPRESPCWQATCRRGSGSGERAGQCRLASSRRGRGPCEMTSWRRSGQEREGWPARAGGLPAAEAARKREQANPCRLASCRFRSGQEKEGRQSPSGSP